MSTDAQLDPASVLDPERFLDYEHGSSVSPLVPRVLTCIDRPGVAICDVGGASGRFLDHIAGHSERPIRGTILEVVPEYRDRLVRPDLEFVHASIVDNDLESEQFDIVTARHVLHHLVGDSVRATLALQRSGLAEMLRLTRPGGHLIFQEQVHYVRPFARAVYQLSRLANRLRIRVRYFETGKVVVSFMTPGEIRAALDDIGRDVPFEVVDYENTPRRVDWKWKVTVLMARVGDVLYVLRKAA